MAEPPKRQKLRLKTKPKPPENKKKLKYATGNHLTANTAETNQQTFERDSTNSGENSSSNEPTVSSQCSVNEVVLEEFSNVELPSVDVQNPDVLEIRQALRRCTVMKPLFNPKPFPPSKMCSDENAENELPTPVSDDQPHNTTNNGRQRNFKPFPKPCLSWLRRKPRQSQTLLGNMEDNVTVCPSSVMEPNARKDVKDSHESPGSKRQLITHEDVAQPQPDISVDTPAQGCSKQSTTVTESSHQVSLAMCPLCQMEFVESMCQVDRDGHIAACFSASSDDVVW